MSFVGILSPCNQVQEYHLKLQLLPSTFFAIHYSLIILSFDAMESVLLKASLNKPGMRTYNMQHCILHVPNNSQNSLRNVSISQRIATCSRNPSVNLSDIVRRNQCCSLITIARTMQIVAYFLLHSQVFANVIIYLRYINKGHAVA
jgi:hypothetical protein